MEQEELISVQPVAERVVERNYRNHDICKRNVRFSISYLRDKYGEKKRRDTKKLANAPSSRNKGAHTCEREAHTQFNEAR